MRKREREALAAGARMIDDIELDRLWRLALQGEPEHAIEKLSTGGPKKVGSSSTWRRSSEWLFGRKSF
jgi:hypothetical protein